MARNSGGKTGGKSGKGGAKEKRGELHTIDMAFAGKLSFSDGWAWWFGGSMGGASGAWKTPARSAQFRRELSALGEK